MRRKWRDGLPVWTERVVRRVRLNYIDEDREQACKLAELLIEPAAFLPNGFIFTHSINLPSLCSQSGPGLDCLLSPFSIVFQHVEASAGFPT